MSQPSDLVELSEDDWELVIPQMPESIPQEICSVMNIQTSLGQIVINVNNIPQELRMLNINELRTAALYFTELIQSQCPKPMNRRRNRKQKQKY